MVAAWRAAATTERSPALTENVLSGVGDWAPCHCCGRSYLATNLIRFECHPDQGLCVGCVESLYDRSRQIARKLYPIWRLPARGRGRRTRIPQLTAAYSEADAPIDMQASRP